MTIFACCEPEDSVCDCSLEQAIRDLLAADADYVGVALYTGGMATVADLAGSTGPRVPYGVITNLGANNSARIGESCWKYEVLVRLRFFTLTDKQGINLAQAAHRVLCEAGCLCVLEGRAGVRNVPPFPTAGKQPGAHWMTQVNEPFLVRSHS